MMVNIIAGIIIAIIMAQLSRQKSQIFVLTTEPL